MHTRWKFYCNPSGVKLPATSHTWKEQHWLWCLLSHCAEGYCSLPWLLISSSHLSHLPFSDSTPCTSTFLTPSSFCPQLLKPQILSLFLVQALLSSLSIQKNVNVFTSLRRREDIKTPKVLQPLRRKKCPSSEKEDRTPGLRPRLW